MYKILLLVYRFIFLRQNVCVVKNDKENLDDVWFNAKCTESWLTVIIMRPHTFISVTTTCGALATQLTQEVVLEVRSVSWLFRCLRVQRVKRRSDILACTCSQQGDAALYLVTVAFSEEPRYHNYNWRSCPINVINVLCRGSAFNTLID